MKLFARLNTNICQPIFRKLTGWNDIQSQVDTLYFIMNHCLDITKVPKATGELRKTQLAAAEFLRIFHEICEKYDIKYWLDYGTLLGAVRHGSFIPWDDDMDISMTLEDLYKANEILPSELEKYGVSYHKRSHWESTMNIWKAGIILDIFTVESVSKKEVANHSEVKKRLEKYNKYWIKHKNDSFESVNTMRNKIMGTPDNLGIWYHTTESCYDNTIFDNNTIFPLKKMRFEGYDFYIPNNYDEYLKEEFGDYMSFPRNGVLHHHGGGGDPIYMNAKKKGFDLDSFTEELKTIHIN